MPAIFRKDGFRFYFYSCETGEPPHIHVQYQAATAKFWIKPVRLSSNQGLKSKDLAKAARLVCENENLISEKWNEYFAIKN